MPNSTAQKLRIKEGYTLRSINAPADFSKKIGSLPGGVTISRNAKNYDQLHWFVMSKAQMEKELEKVLKLMKDDVILWIYYPKGTSKLQTVLTRDKGWENLLKRNEFTWISLVSFDDTWSTFGSRLKTGADERRKEKPKERIIFDYVDPTTKSVRLPEDIALAFKKNKKQEEFFAKLSFTNKKEYIEWIITAKKEETRNERIKGTLERLAKGWKNPRNL